MDFGRTAHARHAHNPSSCAHTRSVRSYHSERLPKESFGVAREATPRSSSNSRQKSGIASDHHRLKDSKAVVLEVAQSLVQFSSVWWICILWRATVPRVWDNKYRIKSRACDNQYGQLYISNFSCHRLQILQLCSFCLRQDCICYFSCARVLGFSLRSITRVVRANGTDRVAQLPLSPIAIGTCTPPSITIAALNSVAVMPPTSSLVV